MGSCQIVVFSNCHKSKKKIKLLDKSHGKFITNWCQMFSKCHKSMKSNILASPMGSLITNCQIVVRSSVIVMSKVRENFLESS